MLCITEITVNMPQISSNMNSVPELIDFLGDQIKSSGSQILKLSRNVIDYTKEMNLDAMNCEKFNLIENINEIGDVLLTETMHDEVKEIPFSCNINTEHENASGNKPNTTYLCHRCKVVFNSRATFEIHYK